MSECPNLPESVKIGGHLYSIREACVRDANRRNELGVTRHDPAEIEIDLSYGYRRAAFTLLHEILHCIQACRDLHFRDDIPDEVIINQLEDGIGAVMCDSPEVIYWIVRGLEPVRP